MAEPSFQDQWEAMTQEERHSWVEASLERGHQAEYERALAIAGVEGPAWADLTDVQRDNIRRINREEAEKMAELGRKISSGEMPTGLRIIPVGERQPDE